MCSRVFFSQLSCLGLARLYVVIHTFGVLKKRIHIWLGGAVRGALGLQHAKFLLIQQLLQLLLLYRNMYREIAVWYMEQQIYSNHVIFERSQIFGANIGHNLAEKLVDATKASFANKFANQYGHAQKVMNMISSPTKSNGCSQFMPKQIHVRTTFCRC